MQSERLEKIFKRDLDRLDGLADHEWLPSARVAGRRTTRGRARRIAFVLVAAAFAISASLALADSPTVRLILTTADSARIRIGALPEAPVRMSLAEAEQKAGVTALRAPEVNGIRLTGVELVPPVTEILGQPVANPQPRIRLTYDIRGVTAAIEEQRNPRPGEPMLIAPVGPPHGRVETEGSIQRFYVYNESRDGVFDVAWGTPDLWIRVHFQPALDVEAARRFIGSLR
jgi:hypothetical protein